MLASVAYVALVYSTVDRGWAFHDAQPQIHTDDDQYLRSSVFICDSFFRRMMHTVHRVDLRRRFLRA